MRKLLNIFLCIMVTPWVIVSSAKVPEQKRSTDELTDNISLKELMKGDTVPSAYGLAEFVSHLSNELRNSGHNPLTQEDTLLIIKNLKQFIREYPAKVRAQEEYDRQKHELEKTAFREYLDSLRVAGVEIDGHVYHSVDNRPEFSNINRFFAENFRYPKDSWKRERIRSVRIEGIVRKDGSMIEMAYEGVTDPELISELERVVRKMHWTPGSNGKGPLNVIRSFSVDLTPWKDKGSPVPYGLESIITHGREGIENLSKLAPNLRQYDPSATIDNVKECALMFPEYTDVSVPFLGFLSAYGDSEKALTLADTLLISYNPDRYLKNDNRIRPLDRGYNGKSEILLSLTRLIQQSHYGLNPDSAYADIDDLLNHRIVDGDIYRRWNNNQRHKQRIEQMQRDMVMEFSKGKAGLDRTTPVWDKITREYSIDELSSGLAYWSDRGMIDNAAVGQLSALINQEYELMRKGKGVTDKDRLNLFGTKALAVWLKEGEEGMRSYIAETQSGQGSKQLKSYLAKLQKSYDRNAAALADRKGVIESLACLVPPQGTDEEGCKAFYERRRAAEKVFPLKWLQSN